MHKRAFIKGLAVAGLGLPLTGSGMSHWISRHDAVAAGELAGDEAFWTGIRNGYKLKPEYINLENGYYNLLPEEILNHFLQQVRDVNYQGAYYMRTVQFDNKKNITARLAKLAGCSADELIITRNTTESLDMIIGGLHWNAGDEAIMAEQDYGSMLAMFRQVTARHGVINKVLSVPNHPASDEELVNLYASAITPKTKLLMVSHMIRYYRANCTGKQDL